jgi:DNA-binding transcriptional ArsR family regulator
MFAIPRPESELPPDLWGALADPTRRALLDRLAAGPLSTSALCEGLPMSRFGVMKHLGVLEAAGLVITRKQGRLRLNHLNAAPLEALHAQWLSPRASAWASGALTFANESGDAPMASNTAGGLTLAEIALEWPVNRSVQSVWQALFDHPEAWWPAAHRAAGDGARMTLEPRLGAHLQEEAASGAGVLWYTVIGLVPMRSVDLRGDLASRYGGPATSLLHIEVLPGVRDQTSVLKLTDSVFGRLGPDMHRSVTLGWQAIIGDGLVAYLETGAR